MQSQNSFVCPSLEELNAILPNYEFLAFVAKGGMGAVYLARQRSLDREVAIKILPPEMSGDQQFRERFITEAKAMACLHHPNLIMVYDFGEVNEMFYIVMEFVNGYSLHEAAGGNAILPEEAVRLVRDVARALAYAHGNNILHRDVKPANILIEASGRPKLGDFGLAHKTDEKQTNDGSVFGTPEYLAPEVWKNQQVDAQADIFAMGIILYELLTGKLPAENSFKAASSSSEVDSRMDDILYMATHPERDRRYCNAEAFARDLSEWLDVRRMQQLQPQPAAMQGHKPKLNTAPAVPARNTRSLANIGVKAPHLQSLGATQANPASVATKVTKAAPSLGVGVLRQAQAPQVMAVRPAEAGANTYQPGQFKVGKPKASLSPAHIGILLGIAAIAAFIIIMSMR